MNKPRKAKALKRSIQKAIMFGIDYPLTKGIGDDAKKLPIISKNVLQKVDENKS
jgi:predicted TIM-barrel fold metal-dependent hydrolase